MTPQAPTRPSGAIASLVAVAALCGLCGSPAFWAGCSSDPAFQADAAPAPDDLAMAPGGDLPFRPLDLVFGGQDGSAGPDAAPMSCLETPTSTLAGVSLRFLAPPCRFTLAQAAAGVRFDFDLLVEQEVPSMLPDLGDGNGCGGPDASGLMLRRTISGGGQNWCICDVGRCLPYTPVLSSIVRGRHPGSISWRGGNWSGPSDFNQPEGPPFPPGAYQVQVSATGQYTVGALTMPFTIRDVLEITVLP